LSATDHGGQQNQFRPRYRCGTRTDRSLSAAFAPETGATASSRNRVPAPDLDADVQSSTNVGGGASASRRCLLACGLGDAGRVAVDEPGHRINIVVSRSALI
jgi:hypothetical protein